MPGNSSHHDSHSNTQQHDTEAVDVGTHNDDDDDDDDCTAILDLTFSIDEE